jgi:precorrin-6B methylase 2
VVESGTGSGSLTHALARSVGPTGKVFTFEFSEDRVNKARAEFASHRLTDRVICTHRDAVASGFQPECPKGRANAVFLDLPNPWGALQFAKDSLMPNGILCSFSPCIEQVQRVCEALVTLGFEEIRTFESLSRVFDVTQNAEARQAPIDIYGVLNKDRQGGELDTYDNVNIDGGMDDDGDESKMDIVDQKEDSNRFEESRGSAAERSNLKHGDGFLIKDHTGDNQTRTQSFESKLEPSEKMSSAHVFKPAPWTRSIVEGSRHLVSPAPQGRGHTGYLTFATLYSKNCNNK